MNIYILHPGKASYPEISAYRNYFGGRFDVFDGCLADYSLRQDKQATILWCVMGYYPSIIEAGYVIHDYRSLSVGKLSKLKDKIKRMRNIKPDLRIFQNNIMKSVMGFDDGIPSVILPMGVPEWIFNLQPNSRLPKATYCYIGEITRERGMDNVIESFVKNMPESETFVLVGRTEPGILNKYNGKKNLIFTGQLSQVEALQVVMNCDYAVSRVPRQYPYCYQAPTKLLEYAALNKIILCNDSLSNVNSAAEINADVIFVSDNIFDGGAAVLRESSAVGPSKTFLSWGNVIRASGVDFFVDGVSKLYV